MSFCAGALCAASSVRRARSGLESWVGGGGGVGGFWFGRGCLLWRGGGLGRGGLGRDVGLWMMRGAWGAERRLSEGGDFVEKWWVGQASRGMYSKRICLERQVVVGVGGWIYRRDIHAGISFPYRISNVFTC